MNSNHTSVVDTPGCSEAIKRALNNFKHKEFKKISEFQKVPFEIFLKDFKKNISGADRINESLIKSMWDDIKIPERSSKYSAGYDFRSPFTFKLTPGKNIIIPTGIRCKFNENHKNYTLMIFPRSSFGWKSHSVITNTVGIIDADYYNDKKDKDGNNLSEGHILLNIKYNGVNDKVECLGLCPKPVKEEKKSLLNKFFTKKEEDVEPDILQIQAGDRICQGVFLEYGVVNSENLFILDEREGGIGSSNKKN